MNNGRRRNNGEKPKDFKKSMLLLFNYCKPYFIPVLLAVILAMISSILSIIGPDQLRKITNLITEGLMTGINIEKIVKANCNTSFNYLWYKCYI